ncbi:MAG: hypothetical protein AB7F86_01600 [Bdellovibrionales bacterium]
MGLRLFRLLLGSSLLLISFSSYAGYFSQMRPHILNVAPSAATVETPAGWNALRRGYMLLMAELMAFFPDDDYYFLARDIEYLHDVAVVLLKNDPKLSARLHLVPVSSNVSQSGYLKQYLTQEGINTANLQGRSALVIDSCCAGSIPKKIINYFAGVQKVRGFLISTTAFPKSNLFENYSGYTGNSIEGHPHYTASASHIENVGGKLEVVVNQYENQKASEKIMASIRYHLDNEGARQEFFEITGLMRDVFDFITGKTGHASTASAAYFKLKNTHGIPMEHFEADIRTMGMYATIHEERFPVLTAPKTSTAEVIPTPVFMPAPVPAAVSPLEHLLPPKGLVVGQYGETVAQGLKMLVKSVDVIIKDPGYSNAPLKWFSLLPQALKENPSSTMVRNALLVGEKAGVLDQALKWLIKSLPASAFEDSDEDHPVADDITSAVASGITTAAGTQGFDPDGSIMKATWKLELTASPFIMKRLFHKAMEEVGEQDLHKLLYNILTDGNLVKNRRLARWIKNSLERFTNIAPVLVKRILDVAVLQKQNRILRRLYDARNKISEKGLALPISKEVAKGLHIKFVEGMTLKNAFAEYEKVLKKKKCEEALDAA